MIILETIQPVVFLLVLLAAVALGTQMLGGFMLRLDAEPAAEDLPTVPLPMAAEAQQLPRTAETRK